MKDKHLNHTSTCMSSKNPSLKNVVGNMPCDDVTATYLNSHARFRLFMISIHFTLKYFKVLYSWIGDFLSLPE